MTLRRTIRRLLIGLALVVIGLAIYLLVLVVTTPDVDHLRDTMPAQTSYMRLRAAQSANPTADRVDAVDLGDVSPYLVCAVVKAEDHRFFRHHGFDWAQIRKALWGNLTGGSRIGGSTITQQLARNLYLSPDRSLHRKLREALITRRLERALDKRRILELYLSVVEWGDHVWGASQAARVYFGRSPAELGAFEGAFLASLLPAPRAALRGNNLQRAIAAQRRVLHQMLVSALIDRSQFTDAMTRVTLLSLHLSAGESLAEALAHASAAATGTPTLIRPPSLTQVLADHCGLGEEIAVSERARVAKGH